MMSLTVEGINKSFGSHQVLNNISFTLEAGRKVALLGASGCGKSLLFHILSNLTQADSGRITFDGRQLSSPPISYMQQKDLLLPWLSLTQNAALPLTLAKVSEEEASKEVESHLERFGLKGFEGHYPHQLSGGMRQRVALLRTMLHRKPIVLMDEPFSAVDALTAHELRSFVRQLQQKEGFSLFFVTHNVEEALDLADEVWVMHKDGQPQIKKMTNLTGDYTQRRALLWQELGLSV